MDDVTRKNLENRLQLLFQQLELSVQYEEEWSKFLSSKQIQEFRDRVLDEINAIKDLLNGGKK